VKDKAPSGYQKEGDVGNPPNSSLELEYIYGYRCHDTRNNLRYDNKGRITYHCAGVGISMDSAKA
jgi:microtubule-associated protein-like 6